MEKAKGGVLQKEAQGHGAEEGMDLVGWRTKESSDGAEHNRMC